jgi:hypothetical protein
MDEFIKTRIRNVRLRHSIEYWENGKSLRKGKQSAMNPHTKRPTRGVEVIVSWRESERERYKEWLEFKKVQIKRVVAESCCLLYKVTVRRHRERERGCL